MRPPTGSPRRAIPEELKGFYAFHSCLMEPWDDPAAVAFEPTSGARLRPHRYVTSIPRRSYVAAARPSQLSRRRPWWLAVVATSAS